MRLVLNSIRINPLIHENLKVPVQSVMANPSMAINFLMIIAFGVMPLLEIPTDKEVWCI